MSFENPDRLIWALLAAPLAIIYLWPFVRKQSATATLDLWKEAIAGRSLWERLHRYISLVCMLVALLLLVFAIAEPFFTSSRANPRIAVLILDISASMQAVDGEISRVEAAKATAKEFVNRMGDYDSTAIILATDVQVVQSRFTSDRELLHAAIADAPATDRPMSAEQLAAAITLAKQMPTAEDETAEVWLLTDAAGANSLEPSFQEQVKIIAHGDSIDNVAIVQLGARTDPNKPGKIKLLAEVSNFGSTKFEGDLKIGVVEGEELTEPLTIAAGESQTTIVDLSLENDGSCFAQLESNDSLASDNRSELTVVAMPATAIVSTDTPEPWLQAWQDAGFQVLATPGDDARTVNILQGRMPDTLPTAPCLVIDPTGDCDWWREGKPIASVKDAIVARWTTAGSDFAPITIQDVVIERLRRLEFTSPATTLAATESGDAVISLVQRPGGDVLVSHIFMNATDWHLRDSFFKFLTLAPRQLLPAIPPQPSALTTLDQFELPATSPNDAEIKTPRGAMLTSGNATKIALTEAGSWQQNGSQLAFANLHHRGESDLRATPTVESAALPSQNPRPFPLWIPLVMLALLVLIFDWVWKRSS